MPLTVEQTTTLAFTLKSLVQRVDFESDDNILLNIILQGCQANLTALNSFHETEKNESTDEVNKQLNRLGNRTSYAHNGCLDIRSQINGIIESTKTQTGFPLSKHNELIDELADAVLISCEQAYKDNPKNRTWANYFGIFQQFISVGMGRSSELGTGQLIYRISSQDTELEEIYTVLLTTMNDYARQRLNHIESPQEMDDFSNFKAQFERILENPIYSKASMPLREKLGEINAYIEAKTTAVALPVARHSTDESMPTAFATLASSI